MIRHKKQLFVPDGGDPNLVQASDWNDTHEVDGLLGELNAIVPQPNTFPVIEEDGDLALAPVTNLALNLVKQDTPAKMRALLEVTPTPGPDFASETEAVAGKATSKIMSPALSMKAICENGRWPLRAFATSGIIGTNAATNSTTLQKALNEMVGVALPGTSVEYDFSTNVLLETGDNPVVAKLPEIVNIKGVRGKTVIKLKDGISENGAVPWWNILGGNRVHSFSCEDVIFDYGVNPISPGRLDNAFNDFNTAAVIGSGSPTFVGESARFIDFYMRGCGFRNGPGVSNIVLGHSSLNAAGGGTGAVLGSQAWLLDNWFYNNGNDSKDYSGVYSWMKRFVGRGNMFDHPTLSNGQPGPVAAFELHGSDNMLEGNIINNFLQAAWIAHNYTETSKRLSFNNNKCRVRWHGVKMETGSQTLEAVSIRGNEIYIAGGGLGGSTRINYPKRAIDLHAAAGVVNDIMVSQNLCVNEDAGDAEAIVVSAAAGANIVGAQVIGNKARGFRVGVAVGVTGGGTMYNTDVRTNHITGLGPSSMTASSFGVLADGPHENLSIAGQRVIGGAGAPTHGVAIAGPVNGLHIDGNSGNGDMGSLVTIFSTITGKRTGAQSVPPASVVINPSSLADNAGQTFGPYSVPGARTGDRVEVSWSATTSGCNFFGWVDADDTVYMRVVNQSGGTLDLPSGTARIKVVPKD